MTTQVPSNLIPVRVTQLPTDSNPSQDGLIMYVRDGVNYKVRIGDVASISGVPPTTQVLAGTGMTGGGQLSTNVTLSVAPGGIGSSQLNNTGVTPGVYGSNSDVPVLTIDANGRVEAATTVNIGTWEISTVAGSIANVNSVAVNISAVIAVDANEVNIDTVAGSLSNVNTVATSIGDVNSVAANLVPIAAVDANAVNIDTIAGNLANVVAVGSSIASVNSAATNMAAILDAPTQASNAATSASNALTSATNAANSATNAATSASNAATSASDAATQASLSTTNGAAQVALATTQAGIATTKASEASASQAAALLSENAAHNAQISAETAQALAELARDNVFAVSTIYPDTATALAAVAEGDYFSIASTGDIYMQLYQKVSGAAVFINQFYGTAKIDQIETTQTITAFVQAAAISHIQANLASTLVFP